MFLKRSYASVITRELRLNNNSSTDTYNSAGGLSTNYITDKNTRDLKIKFGIDNIPIESYQLANMYRVPKMHKIPIKVSFIALSPKFSIKALARTITSIFRLSFKQMQTYNDKSRFSTDINTIALVQNNKPVTDAINRLNNVGNQLLFQPLTFLTCILNGHIINF